MEKELKIGNKIPNFKLPDDEGQVISSADLLAKGPFVIYFYPRDNTPGCTREAQGFTDHFSKFKKLGVNVVGVSTDSPASHQKFREKYNLPFTLLCGEEQTVSKKFGVWVEKNNYGKKYFGIQRSTFLVDKSGIVVALWPKVKVDGHVDEVMKAAKLYFKK